MLGGIYEMKIIFEYILFIIEISLFFVGGFYFAIGYIIPCLIITLSGIVFAIIVGQEIYKRGKKDAIR